MSRHQHRQRSFSLPQAHLWPCCTHGQRVAGTSCLGTFQHPHRTLDLAAPAPFTASVTGGDPTESRTREKDPQQTPLLFQGLTCVMPRPSAVTLSSTRVPHTQAKTLFSGSSELSCGSSKPWLSQSLPACTRWDPSHYERRAAQQEDARSRQWLLLFPDHAVGSNSGEKKYFRKNVFFFSEDQRPMVKVAFRHYTREQDSHLWQLHSLTPH